MITFFLGAIWAALLLIGWKLNTIIKLLERQPYKWSIAEESMPIGPICMNHDGYYGSTSFCPACRKEKAATAVLKENV